MAERKKSVQGILDAAGDGKQAQRLARAEDMETPAFLAAQTRKLQRIAAKLADRLEAECGDLPLTSVAINLGIVSDKLRDVGAIAAPAIHNQTNIQVNGLSRDDLSLILCGKRLPTKRELVALGAGAGAGAASGARQKEHAPRVVFPQSSTPPLNRQRATAPTPVPVDVSALSVNAESTVSP